MTARVGDSDHTRQAPLKLLLPLGVVRLLDQLERVLVVETLSDLKGDQGLLAGDLRTTHDAMSRDDGRIYVDRQAGKESGHGI